VKAKREENPKREAAVMSERIMEDTHIWAAFGPPADIPGSDSGGYGPTAGDPTTRDRRKNSRRRCKPNVFIYLYLALEQIIPFLLPYLYTSKIRLIYQKRRERDHLIRDKILQKMGFDREGREGDAY
jgi:hypothetical protein